MLYLNHVGLCTEEISESGEAYVFFFLEMTPRHWAYMYFFSLGNAVQGFTCVAFVDFFSSIVLILVCFS